MSNNTNISDPLSFLNGNAGAAQGSAGITTRAFLLNLAIGFGLFSVELTIFFVLKSSSLGRRILYVLHSPATSTPCPIR
jgi:hypothetical protein